MKIDKGPDSIRMMASKMTNYTTGANFYNASERPSMMAGNPLDDILQSDCNATPKGVTKVEDMPSFGTENGKKDEPV